MSIYYISNSMGNDANDGRTIETPWKTIEKLSTVKLLAGDQVCLRSGDIWIGKWELDVSGGTKQNPIFIHPYGEGSKPALQASNKQVKEKGSDLCLLLKNANGLVVENISVGYANLGIRLFYDVEHYRSNYVCFRNCHFHDIYGVTQLDSNPVIYVSAAIDTRLADERKLETEEYALKGLYLHQCTSYDAGTLVCGPVGVHGFYMTECIAEKNGYYGTTAFGCKGGYIDHCLFDGNGTRPMPAGSCGIMVAAIDFTIKNSQILNQQRQGDDPDGCGIDYEWDNHNVHIQDCVFSGNAGVGVMFFTSGQNERGANIDCSVTRNLFLNNHTNPGNVFGGEIFIVRHGLKNGRISDNLYKKMPDVDFLLMVDHLSVEEAFCDFVYENNNGYTEN